LFSLTRWYNDISYDAGYKKRGEVISSEHRNEINERDKKIKGLEADKKRLETEKIEAIKNWEAELGEFKSSYKKNNDICLRQIKTNNEMAATLQAYEQWFRNHILTNLQSQNSFAAQFGAAVGDVNKQVDIIMDSIAKGNAADIDQSKLLESIPKKITEKKNHVNDKPGSD